MPTDPHRPLDTADTLAHTSDQRPGPVPGPGQSPAPLRPTPPSSPSSSAFLNAPALNPGDTLLSRYRIVARLGKGGMGEVFRADDLVLGVPVALKFLPAELSADAAWVDRFRAEVRLARQISHPNVCRVFDIVELPASAAPSPAATPRIFLAMEYIDGEDLAGLLRRIGRLPHDKAVQIARQICFAVAAAHDQGVIHRDLKPANIMIDGRGNARITDFGVAGLVEHFAPAHPGSAPRPRADITAGTPAYMAPEQLAGTEVSKRSDIYSLGLVLYELFTGKRANTATTIEELRTLTQSATPHTRPSELIADLDPAVERVILRCLERNPADRPQSAIAVAAALPGGDPLAAALAAGETPSPELVARSGEVGAISARTAALALAVVVALLLGCLIVGDRINVLARGPTPLAPEVLAAKARETLQALQVDPGYDEAFGFVSEPEAARWIERSLSPEQRQAAYALGAPTTVAFWLRQSPQQLYPLGWFRRWIILNDPAWREPGHAVIMLSPQGELLRFSRVPYEGGSAQTPPELFAEPAPPPPPPEPPPAIDRAIRAAGLDPQALQPTRPLRTPTVGSDRRYAFLGSMPALEGLPPIPVRVEAAALDDRLVSFSVLGPWDSFALEPAKVPLSAQVFQAIAAVLITACLIAAVLLARANVRSRRSDTRGAVALGATIFAAELISMVVPRHTLADILTFEAVGRPTARALWASVLTVLLYIALEPIVRKRRPDHIISWARLITGDWRNPRIARDLLLGVALGVFFCFLLVASLDLVATLGLDSKSTMGFALPLPGISFVASYLVSPLGGSAALALFMTLLFVGAESLLKRRALAFPVVVAFMFITAFANNVQSPVGILLGLLGATGLVFTLARVGILGAMAYLYSVTTVSSIPMVASLDSWMAMSGLTVIAVIAALAAWAAYRASLAFTVPAHVHAAPTH